MKKRRIGATSLVEAVLPEGRLRVTNRSELEQHAGGGRERGRLADRQVREWCEGRAPPSGDAARVAFLLRRLNLRLEQVQVYVAVDRVFAFVDMLLRTPAGEAVLAEQKVGFAGTWLSANGCFGGLPIPIPASPLNAALLQLAIGCELYERHRGEAVKGAIVVRVLDRKVSYTACPASFREAARRLIAHALAPARPPSTTRTASRPRYATARAASRSARRAAPTRDRASTEAPSR